MEFLRINDDVYYKWVTLNYATSRNEQQRATTSLNDLQRPPRKPPSITILVKFEIIEIQIFLVHFMFHL